MTNIKYINDLIQNRKSVFPVNYKDKVIPNDIIDQILKNADRAPTHKFTEPWRFKVLKGKIKNELGKFLSEKYKEITHEGTFNESKFRKIRNNVLKTDTIISIHMQRDPKEQIPEWEEIASVAMAVQNMHLSCTAYGIGCYWSSPGTIPYMSEFYRMSEGEKCFGFLYMGYYNKNLSVSKRKPLNTKVEWL